MATNMCFSHTCAQSLPAPDTPPRQHKIKHSNFQWGSLCCDVVAD